MSERTRLHYPTVYVVHTEDKNRYKSVPDYTVYVGETNSIRNRTSQHLKTDSNVREDWKDFADRLQSNASSAWQYVIADGHFNKSMTLDVENKLMHYLLGSEAVKNLNNRRANAQGDYYTKSEFDRFFSNIWFGLHNGIRCYSPQRRSFVIPLCLKHLRSISLAMIRSLLRNLSYRLCLMF